MTDKITYFLFAFILFSADGFGQITDNFSDGDFTVNPTWTGNDTDFIVNTSQQLQLNSSGTSASYLSIPNTQSISGCEWNFWINLNFSPSSSNYARVYLVSNQADLSASLNGYYLQFGESLSNDQVELFRQTGSTSVSVCRGTTNISNAFTIRVKVTRDAAGLWQLYIDPAGGTAYALEASGTDNTHNNTSCFGAYCKYTTTNATKFFFDDFYIYSPPDVTPPVLDSVVAVSQNQADAYFNEALNLSSAQTVTNYSVSNSIGIPSVATQDVSNYSLVHLTFSNNFVSAQTYTLTATGVQDVTGNTMASTAKSFIFSGTPAVTIDAFDIVINEILFDPKDNGVEWIEIYNRSQKTIDLKDVYLCSQDNAGNLSDIHQIAPNGYLLLPQSYLVLSENAAAIKSQYTCPNPSDFVDMSSIPSLNNDSDYVVLATVSQMLIDKLHYHAEWHLPLLSDTKGISLERINYDNPTQDANNWHSAADNIGNATPAYKNSQYTNGENDTDVSVNPEVFSPDNDGYNDVLSINYQFDTPGRIGNVNIYDSRGRLERTLVRNELLSSSGNFFWDGINDEKEKSRIGIYIVWLEAFDTKGNVKRYKKTCVVAGKL